MAGMKQTDKGHSPRRVPWWIHIIIASLLYIGLTYFAPTLQIENRWVGTLLEVAPNLAPICAVAFLLLGAKALYDTPEKKTSHQDGTEENL